MKKIFLINFSTPILIDVARNLKERGFDIVYWQGYRDAFDELARNKTGFENTIFRHSFDAIKNIPPQGLDPATFELPNQEIIESMHLYGWHALSMVSRADYKNTLFVERRHLYYEYLKFWYGMIKKFKPDAIVFVAIPPSAALFTLYGLAQILGVRVVALERLIIDSRTLLGEDYQNGCIALRDEYERNKNKPVTLDELSEDLRTYYDKQRRKEIAVVASGTRYDHLNTSKNSIPFRFPTPVIVWRHLRRGTFFRVVASYLGMLFSKRKTNYYSHDLTGLQWMLHMRRWGKMGKRFRKEYQALQSELDFQTKYVYVPLSFQPEQTTCPMGGVFDDQLLMIDMLAAGLPEGWVLYVKEHLPQWFSQNTETHMYRYEGYYREIAAKRNVRLVPAETSPVKLIKHAQAVATVTGTTGWEAVVRGTPALVFGSVWYMYCEGVFRVSGVGECREAFEKIKNGYRLNQQKVINYLAALDRVSIKAKYYKTREYIPNEHVSREENISNLTEALHNALIR